MQDPAVNGGAAAFQLAVNGTPQFPQEERHLKCPRCESTNTKFCYYNNYNLSQPRHFCKDCRRYWTKGGALRKVPVGGATRKTSSKRSSAAAAVPPSAAASPPPPPRSLGAAAGATPNPEDPARPRPPPLLQLPPALERPRRSFRRRPALLRSSVAGAMAENALQLEKIQSWSTPPSIFHFLVEIRSLRPFFSNSIYKNIDIYLYPGLLFFL
ncbi:unnamed protein product [Spirodela intermedia]|uniref:Dof zinc finger protein n=1 Tax=Spirodela intermedia TaxID=51605 RepID=A0A7I8JT83_SPIIN|nr:unnamed protein product [Spirodela intermedia]CAA6672823.1 unnamed protein product [Spirodela intermedia]